jgi:predicted DNA-binding transcriptional regulator YafY
MLTPDEIEAAVLGAQWVAGRGDPALATAASDLIAKIGAVIPEHLRPFLIDSTVSASGAPRAPPDKIDLTQLRAWIHSQRKVALCYRDEEERETRRIVWPIGVGYYEAARIIIAWCELRVDFRHFRTDRIVTAEFLLAQAVGRGGRAAVRPCLNSAARSGFHRVTPRPDRGIIAATGFS